jgi:hypothetical protein
MLKELEGYDWGCAFEYAGGPAEYGSYGSADLRRANPVGNVSLDPFGREDVVKIAGIVEGMNDEAPWECLGKLKDGRWFFLSAGCDYTGWDCQAGGSATVARTKAELIKFGLTDSEKTRLGV